MSDDIKPNTETSPEDGKEFDKSGEVQKSTAEQSFQDSSSDNQPGATVSGDTGHWPD